MYLAMTHPGATIALFTDADTLIKDDFPSWHDAELAAAHLDAIADTPSDPPSPGDPTPPNVGDDPPPWCRACDGPHATYHCPAIRALLLA